MTRGRAGVLQAIPLGGLGEFGINCMAYRYEDSILVVDCGAMFPDDGLPGVDFVIPDLGWLHENAGHVVGVFLTHAHDDHVGALPWLFPRITAPLFATRFTLALVGARLDEHGIRDEIEPRTLRDRQPVTAGPFTVEPIPVTHSIVDAVALAITTPAGTILHTSDFKIDHTPPDGRHIDLFRFAELGRAGVLALFSDSTNVTRPGWTGSELSVRERLEELIRTAPERVIVSTFSSHIHRIQQIADIAKRFNRKIAFLGRSLQTSTRVAREIGALRVDERHELPPRELMQLPARNQLIVAAGAQGEPMAALSRIALSEHRDVEVGRGDRVILSAKIIPGNERLVSNLVNHFYKRGCDVITEETDRRIHVSGHGAQEELKTILNLVRPRNFVPIHGEYRFLSEHANIAVSTGIPRSRTFVIENGQVIEFERGEARLGDRVKTGRVFIDGGSLSQVEEIVLRDRQHLSEDGIVIPILGVNAQSGVVEAEVISRGFVWVDGQEELLARARGIVLETLTQASPEERADAAVVKAKVRRALRRFFRSETGKGPMIIPVVLEV